MTRRYLLFIKDMLDAVDRIHAFVKGMGFDDFAADDKTVSAVLRKLEVIGEAAKNVPTAVRERHGAVPWSRLAKMRDRLIHGYFAVDNEIVWKVVTEELPELREELERVYESESRES
jgi:uncharacterized protein with HEPN domain